MATGSVKGEKHGSDAITAAVVAEEFFPLPDGRDNIELSYPNKATESDIIRPSGHMFLRPKNGSFERAVKGIKPNAYLLSDNFFGMQKLLETHAGKVSLIYLDPPFQTGLEFQSRQLKHAYKDLLAPATYLEFMRRRLILMRELLADNGSLYLHIGHQMVFHLKVLLDEIFGKNNFRNMIVRKKCSSKNYTKNQYPNLHDYILFYTKSSDYIWNQPTKPADEDWINKEYTKKDDDGRYKLVPIHAPGTRNGETGKPWRGKMPPKGKHWQVPPAKLDELDRDGLIHWSKNGNPRRKVYLSDDKQLPLTDYWDDYRDAHHQSVKITGYPTEKNFGMLKVIVGASSNAGDLVIDPFCGSGTTLHAAEDLGRKWIGIDESFTSAETVFGRFTNGLSPMGDFVEKPGVVAGEKISGNAKAPKRSKTKYDFLVDERLFERYPNEVDQLINRLKS